MASKFGPHQYSHARVAIEDIVVNSQLCIRLIGVISRKLAADQPASAFPNGRRRQRASPARRWVSTSSTHQMLHYPRVQYLGCAPPPLPPGAATSGANQAPVCRAIKRGHPVIIGQLSIVQGSRALLAESVTQLLARGQMEI